MPKKAIDLTGKKFTRLTVISRAKNKNGRVYWNCICSCGAKTIVESYKLNTEHTRSCGCLAIDLKTKHGLTNTTEHKIWAGIKQRCLNPSNPSYKDYGDRGISVCKQWKYSFEIFLADMGKRPSTDYSIDRIDNNGNYTPENCRWATSVEQLNNTRRNIRLTYNGETKTMAQWNSYLGLPAGTINGRIHGGWSASEAVSGKRNSILRKDNKSGVVGVSWSKKRKKWLASINVNGKMIALGCHDEVETAAIIVKAAKEWYNKPKHTETLIHYDILKGDC